MLPFKYGGKEGTGQCALPVCRRLCGIPCVHAQTSKEDVPSAKVISPHSGGHCECKDIIIASYPQRRMPHVHVQTTRLSQKDACTWNAEAYSQGESGNRRTRNQNTACRNTSNRFWTSEMPHSLICTTEKRHAPTT